MEGAVSAASYVVEPPDLWSAPGIAGAPEWESPLSESGGAPAWRIGDFRCTIPAWQVQAVLAGPEPRGATPVDVATLPEDLFHPSGRVARQDTAGVAAEVLYPSPQLWGSMAILLEADAEIACVRAYNDWLAEFVGTDPDRLVGVAAMPSGAGTAAAVDELRRAAELGLRGALLRTFPTSGERALVEDDDRFWAALVDTGVVLSFDSSFGPSPGGQLSGSKGADAANALTPFVYEGVVERFPDLRIVLANHTAGWIPHWLERIDDLYLRRPGARNPDLTRELPSDYLRVRPFFTFAGDDLLLRFPDDYVSFTHLMWSSQFPTYHAADGTAEPAGLAALPDDVRERVRAANCRGLYGLPGGAAVDLEPPVAPLPHAIPV
jgi:predicted TIM-barrel fold metal-dependent hydrolase